MIVFIDEDTICLEDIEEEGEWAENEDERI